MYVRENRVQQSTIQCTNFCERLYSSTFTKHQLPSHSDLVGLFSFDQDTDQLEVNLGCWQNVQERTCAFCRLVSDAIKSDIAVNNLDPKQSIGLTLFPGEQCFRLSYPSRLGLRLAFLTEDRTRVSGPDNARIIPEGDINVSQISEWLQKCSSTHDECSLKLKHNHHGTDSGLPKSLTLRESATSNFRVIDLERQCLVAASLSVRYVTLSYVWGQSPMFRLRKDNFEQLTTVGSLNTIREDLPKTINDAFDLIISLGLRYLWVDGLCLVQDDAADVALGISMMNTIYSGSYFTVVAASGADATAGLYCQRKIQTPQQIGSLQMTYLHGIDWHLQRSIYNDRGWTLQELVLPRRTVIFIDGQVFFRCREANWCEETWADQYPAWLDPDDSNITRIPDVADGLIPSLWAYQKLVEDYPGRTIRHDGDAIRAIAGITQPLSAGMNTTVIEGLPGYYLDHFLLFISSTGHLRRRSQFASYSWAGWHGHVIWPRENYNWYRPACDWNVTNIILYFKHQSLLEFYSASGLSSSESLTSSRRIHSSPLSILLNEHPSVFENNENLEQKYHKSGWYMSSHVNSAIPEFRFGLDKNLDYVPLTDDEAVRNATQSGRALSLAELDRVNAQHELDRITARITDKMEIALLRNWKAQRSYRLTQIATNTDPKSQRYRPSWPVSNSFRFRDPTDTKSKADRRDLWAQEQHQKSDQTSFEIPIFPNYTVLQFVTISVHLELGESTSRTPHQPTSRFDRISSIPLIHDSQVVGALNPDNIDMLARVGSKIELLVIARSNTPTLGSVLQSNNEHHAMDLLWLLHVVWHNGIAERRGVAQMYKSALDVIVDPRPVVKPVLLG